MDATAHYRNLMALGRAEFLAAAAPAALVRFQAYGDDLDDAGATTMTLDHDQAEETLPHRKDLVVPAEPRIEVYPLTKKPGASFPDRITIGRTPNNDIVVVDHSVSRLHAYVKQVGDGWVVADAGSKNGSWINSSSLAARKERPLTPKTVLRIGDVDLTFFLADELFAVLGGTR